MKKPYYGGQAVIEGVAMQGPEGKAIACRKTNGEIVIKIDQKPSIKKRYPILAKPVIRGFISFAESMISGIKDITWSAAQIDEDESETIGTKEMVLSIALAFIIAVGLFVALPVFLANFAYPFVGDFGRSFFEGLLRAGFFILYIVIISRLEDIKRLFAYHGAEHKTISTYEAGERLTVANARPHSTIHPRCGTSFILMAMMIMIIFYTFVGQTDPLHRILIKVICLPLVAGISYELYRLPLFFPNSILVRTLVAPGLWLQKLTTKEPDDSQLEVAIAALKAVPGFIYEEDVSETSTDDESTPPFVSASELSNNIDHAENQTDEI